MAKASKYARRAAEYEREAARAEPRFRDHYLALARAWRELASSVEASDALAEPRVIAAD